MNNEDLFANVNIDEILKLKDARRKNKPQVLRSSYIFSNLRLGLDDDESYTSPHNSNRNKRRSEAIS